MPAIPLQLITGFLGSGKTTLLTRLVQHPHMSGAAVVINELGEIGIDHDLVTMSSERIALWHLPRQQEFRRAWPARPVGHAVRVR